MIIRKCPDCYITLYNISHHLPLQSELIATCTVLALEAMLNYDVYYV